MLMVWWFIKNIIDYFIIIILMNSKQSAVKFKINIQTENIHSAIVKESSNLSFNNLKHKISCQIFAIC